MKQIKKVPDEQDILEVITDGVCVRVFNGEDESLNKKPLLYDKYNGLLTSFSPNAIGGLYIQTEILDKVPIFGFTNTNKEIKIMKNYGNPDNPFSSNLTKMYRKYIPLHEDRKVDKVYVVNHHQNDMRLIRINHKGKLTIWQLTIMNQDKNYFLTIETQYKALCYKSDESIVCPFFSRNESMTEFIQQVVRATGPTTDFKQLPKNMEELAVIERSPKSYSEKIGEVLFYNKGENFGLIDTGTNHALVRSNQVKREPMRYLLKGELVQYRELVVPTESPFRTIPFEAVGVQPIAA